VAITSTEWNPDGIIVVDTEAPNLDGPALAVAAVVYNDRTGRITRSWTSRCPTPNTCSPWVKKHVLPVIDDPKTGVPVDADSYPAMCAAWRRFYARYRTTHAVLTHVAHPLETGFLADAHHGRTQDPGPYPLLDVATVLYHAGHDPRSVDAYLDTVREHLDIEGTPHHPLYDARVTLAAWLHLRRDRAAAYRRAAWRPLTWRRRARCPHQHLPTREGTIATLLVDHGQKIWRCTTCGQTWSI
jgi:hypothetical protein